MLGASVTHAYVTTHGDRTRWADAPQPGIADLSTDLSDVDCRAALAASFRRWAAVDDGLLPMPAPVDGPADITVGFVRDRPDLVGVVGVTLTTTEGAGADRRIVRAEILLNDDFAWSVDGPRGTLRVGATATHEIGHALGLGHSADRAATMYWHYDAEGAALAEDDRRGLRFLYGDLQGGAAACDQCAVAADCAGGVCLQRFNEDDRPFCARPCGPGCAGDEICVGLQGGGDACVPAHGFCGDGAGLARGAACWGPFQCSGADRCVVFPGDARCSAPCEAPDDCAAGRVCALDPVDLPRVCLPPGPAEAGAACAWATDCASGVCLPSGVCGAWCADGCPPAWPCGHPRWPDQPRVCQPPDLDAGVADLDAALADVGVDAGVDAGLRDVAVDDAQPPDAGADSDRPDMQARADAELPRDLPDRGPIIVERPPPTDAGCRQAAPRDDHFWPACLLLVAGGLRRRFR